MRDDLEVKCFAADHAAERNGAVVSATPSPRRVSRNRNGGWNFQRTWNADTVDLGLRFLQCLHGASQERVSDSIIKARLDDEDARTFAVILLAPTSSWPGHLLRSISAPW